MNDLLAYFLYISVFLSSLTEFFFSQMKLKKIFDMNEFRVMKNICIVEREEDLHHRYWNHWRLLSSSVFSEIFFQRRTDSWLNFIEWIDAFLSFISSMCRWISNKLWFHWIFSSITVDTRKEMIYSSFSFGLKMNAEVLNSNETFLIMKEKLFPFQFSFQSLLHRCIVFNLRLSFNIWRCLWLECLFLLNSLCGIAGSSGL